MLWEGGGREPAPYPISAAGSRRESREIGRTQQILRGTHARNVRHDPGVAYDLDQEYRALVERIRGYPRREAAMAPILAEIEAAYWRERAAQREGWTIRAPGVGASGQGD